MKQKRNKPQINELGKKLQDESGTGTGGKQERNGKGLSNESGCSSGVCQVIWKPESLKR